MAIPTLTSLPLAEAQDTLLSKAPGTASWQHKAPSEDVQRGLSLRYPSTDLLLKLELQGDALVKCSCLIHKIIQGGSWAFSHFSS